jgi:outer membrane protein OmpA-like peptidoglycan-associated protein
MSSSDRRTESSSPRTRTSPSAGLLAALGLVLWGRRGHTAALALALALIPAARAQTAVPGFELERVRLNGGAQHGLLVESGDLLPRFGYRAAITFDYEQDALVLVQSGKRVGAVVSDRVSLHLSGAFSPTDWLDVSLQLPIILQQAGHDVASLGFTPVYSGAAVGTPWLGVRGGLLQERRGNPLDLSLGVALGLPIGTAASLSADGSVSVIPSLGLGKTLASFLRLGGNVSMLIRNARSLSVGSAVSDEVGSLVSTGLVLSTLGSGLRGELSGRVDFPVTRTAVGAELDLGLRYPLFKLLEVYVAGGPGFGALPGTPTFRLLAGVALAPQPSAPAVAKGRACVEGEPYELPACPALDRDGDGVPNGRDRCPEVLGIAALDGCPDVDTDGDGVLDAQDACPKVAGLAALKGCPEPDADQDGVPDSTDACPALAGPSATHGCPDSDGDGLDDSVDACPKVKGVPELKGCPDVDTDGDGVVDRLDACRTEKGVPENAGCPARRKQLVIITKDKLVIKDKVYFATGRSTVLMRSFPLLEQVAAILKEHPEVERLSIEGHTDDRGNHDANVLLSEARASMVRAYLIKAGVQPDRLIARGFGPDRPVESNETPRGRDTNRRVEFMISGAGAPLP